MKNLLVIGSGQCGTRIAHRFHKDLDLCQDNVLLINTSTDDENIKNQVILSEGGSGRNPLYTLETIIPFLKEIFSYGQKYSPDEVLQQLDYKGLDINYLIDILTSEIKNNQ